MRAALGQLDMVWENKEASLCKAEKMIARASEERADIIVFPEMTLTGVSMNIEQIGECAEMAPTLKKMKELAVNYQIAIGFGWAALPEGKQKKATNRFTLIDSQGLTIAEYCKLHPFTYGRESEVFEGGKEIVTVPFLGHTLALSVCYDLRFPEIFQIASRKADVFFVIANWPAVRREHWTALLRARAIENQSYVIGVNCVGERDGLSYTGDSIAMDPYGNILCELSDQEGIMICELDDKCWELRKKFPTKMDRREDLYLSLMEQDKE